MTQKTSPSARKAQEIEDLLLGRTAASDSPILSDLVRLSTERVIQELLEEEQSEFLGRGRYERRGGEQEAHRNGYEKRKLKSAEGVLQVEVPQVRGCETPYRSKVWASLDRTSQVLEEIVTEMWVRGLSVRDVEEALLTSTGAFVMSDTAVSQVTERLYAQYEAFSQRDLSSIDVAYFFMDAVHEPLRRHGSSLSVLCAWGILADGSRVLLGLTTGNGESGEVVTEFLRDLVQRGLRPPLTVTTDGAPGLIKGVDQMWPRSLRIRCWFHKMRNLQQKVPPAAWPAFQTLVKDIRDAPSVKDARKRIKDLVEKHERDFPAACACLQDDLEASLNHLRVPRRHQQLVRTTNLVERTFVEERRRTKVIPHLWDERSVVKLVFAVLIRVSERWSKRQFNEIETRQIHKLRVELQLDARAPKEEPENKKKRRSAGHVAA